MRTRKALRIIPWVAGALILAIPVMAGGAPGERTHPPGNNGTVKVDDVPFDDHPNNEPHVGCIFQLDFYNYDEGDLMAEYTLELWSPTLPGSFESTLEEGEVFIGEDPNGGGTDLDASVDPDIAAELAASGAEPHPQQGYHVRLTVHAEGSIGADVKHKMFWVTGCEVEGTTSPTTSSPTTSSPTTSSPTTSSPTTGSPTTGSPTTGSPTTTSPSLGGGGGTTTVSPTVLGEAETRSPGPGAAAFTGSDLGWMIAAIAGLLLVAAATLRLTSRSAR
jgi:hypothetical protein